MARVPPSLQLFGSKSQTKDVLYKTKANSRGFPILLKPISAVRLHEYHFIFRIKCLMFSFSSILYYITLIKDPLGENVRRQWSLFCSYRVTFLTDWISFSQNGKRWEKQSQGRTIINLINQLLSAVLDDREQICKEGTNIKICRIQKKVLYQLVGHPQGVSSSPALLHLATTSAKKSLTTLTSHWDSIRGRFCFDFSSSLYA